jgi:uncharacterized protein involved in type VI secretion and phage assembly
MFSGTLTVAGQDYTVTRLDGFERTSDRAASARPPVPAPDPGMIAAADEPFFHLSLHMRSVDIDSDLTGSLIDQLATLTVSWKAAGVTVSRVWSGYVFRAALDLVANPAHERPANSYRVELCPWVWYLAYSRRNRHWVNASLDDVFTDVCSAYGFNVSQHWRFESGGDQRFPYVVQHEQSDFDFLMGLLKRLHLSAYITHATDGHLLVIGQGEAAEFWGDEVTLTYSHTHGGSPAKVATAIAVESRTVPTVTKVANRRRAIATTANFGVIGATSPGQPADGTMSGGKMVFSYPAMVGSQGEAESDADSRLGEHEIASRVFSAEIRHLPLMVGQRVLFSHPFDRTGSIDGQGGVVRRLTHRLDKDTYAAWLDATPLA